MGPLELSLFGGFCLTLGGRPLGAFISDKGRALLAYLVIEYDRPHRRAELAALLWPGKPEGASRANLRQTLHRLHEALGLSDLGSPYLLASHHDVQFNRDCDCRVDTVEVKRSFAACLQHRHLGGVPLCPECIERLQAAAGLYRGDLLAGFSLPGCTHFEWWLTCKQEEDHQRAIEIIKRLVFHFEGEKDYLRAIQYAQHAIEIEPWSEYFHRRKMVLLARAGQRIAALRQYAVLRKILSEELNVEPGVETTDLYQQIWAGTLTAG